MNLDLLTHLLLGIAAAMIVTGWQGYKDTPWEDFVFRKFVRSYLIGVLCALLVYASVRSGLLPSTNYGVLLLVIVSIERLIGEVYKGFIRKGSHAEYVKLFERLHISFSSAIIRSLAGILFAVILTAFILLVLSKLVGLILQAPVLPSGLLIGVIGGLLSAIGGAIKDSQFEGFKVLKFIRSPLVGMVGGLLLVHYTRNPLLLLLSITGFERVVVELYKTFIKRSVRGIFEGQHPKFGRWFKLRWLFFVLYACGVTVLIAGLYLS